MDCLSETILASAIAKLDRQIADLERQRAALKEKQSIRTNLTGGKVEGAERIAAWEDGPDDSIIVEWWKLPGSFLRTEYNRRTTCTKHYFEPVGTENYQRLLAENP